MILAPDFAPITHSFGFLELPLDRVASEIAAWSQEIARRVRFQRVSQPFPESLRNLEPLGAPLFKRLWVETSSARWPTAYFDGWINGGDPFPPISYLAKRMRCQGLVIIAAPDSRQMQLYGPHQTDWLNQEWAVSASKDGRWHFHHRGQTQWFEETAEYENRRIGDRFTQAMLIRYASALEVPLALEQYKPSAVLESPHIPAGDWRFETLAQARERFARSK